MTTRLQCCLRMLLAVVTFGCAAITVTAESVAAAPAVAIVAPAFERAELQGERRVARRAAAPRALSPVPPARLALARCPRVHASAPALARAPRLYLRNCVLLR